MPYKDLSTRQAYMKKYNARPERQTKKREYREVNKEKVQESGRKYAAKRRVENPERVRALARVRSARYAAKLRAENPELVRASNRVWYATIKGERRHRETAWARQGIIDMTMERFNAMCDERGHVCEICREGNKRAGKPWSLEVDHDHRTGEARGLLCTHCNRKLGRIEKHSVSGPHKCGVKFTERAIAYMLTVTLRRLNQQSTN